MELIIHKSPQLLNCYGTFLAWQLKNFGFVLHMLNVNDNCLNQVQRQTENENRTCQIR